MTNIMMTTIVVGVVAVVAIVVGSISGIERNPSPPNTTESPSIFEPIREFFSPTDSTPPTIVVESCVRADASGVYSLPTTSPSGQWCRLHGYGGCKAAWCAGYWADQPIVAASTTIYDCNHGDGQGNTKCEKITPAQLPDIEPTPVPQSWSNNPNDCEEVKLRCNGPWPDNATAAFCRAALKGSCPSSVFGTSP